MLKRSDFIKVMAPAVAGTMATRKRATAQASGGAAYIVQVSAIAPGLHALADAVDRIVFHRAVGAPFIKGMLAFSTGFAGARNGDEIGTWPPDS
ncbi:MAG: hypothetical protein ACP5VQ_11655, partial [Phycisphaerae bacterium]